VTVDQVRALLAEWDDAPRERTRDVVLGTLDALAAIAPGRSVEVRIPPVAAIQVIAGPTHTRGTPPAVVETDPRTWLELCVGDLDWVTAVSTGRVRASGERSDLSPYLPLSGGVGRS
jgi:hypothetical protein